MKKLVICLSVVTIFTINLLHARDSIGIEKKIHLLFENPQNLKIYSGEAGYAAYFLSNKMNYQVFFNTTGDFINSIRHSDLSGLPINLLFKFIEKHATKEVSVVVQLIDEAGTKYQLTCQDAKAIYTYNLFENGEIELVNKAKK